MDNFDFIFDNFTDSDFKKVRRSPAPSTSFIILTILIGGGTSLELWHGHGNADWYLYRQEVQLGEGQLWSVQQS